MILKARPQRAELANRHTLRGRLKQKMSVEWRHTYVDRQ